MPLATEQFTCPKCKILFTLTRTSVRLAPADCPEVFRELEIRLRPRSEISHLGIVGIGRLSGGNCLLDRAFEGARLGYR